jgi:membrane protein DedA with SNARE-associated domain
MLTDWGTWIVWFEAALRGAAQPWVICVALVLTTFLLEDLAIAAGAALAVQGSLSWELAIACVGGGIAAGDIGLYGLGLAANRVPYLRRRFVLGRKNWVARQLEDRFGSAILLARVIPGLRLVTYTACGFFRLPLGPFVAWVVGAVTLWTIGLMWLGATMGVALSAALGVPAPLVVGVLIVVLALGLSVLRRAAPLRVGSEGESP